MLKNKLYNIYNMDYYSAIKRNGLLILQQSGWSHYAKRKNIKYPTVGGNVNWYSHYGEQFGDTLEIYT